MFRKKLEHLCLDFDDVLVKTTPVCVNEVITVGKSLTGRTISRNDIVKNWGPPFGSFLSNIFPEIDLSTYFKERERLGLNKVLPTLFPGVMEAIELLSRRFSLSIITSREKITFIEIMKDQKINLDFFEMIQTSDDSDHHKPNPQVLKDLLVRYEAPRTAYVGDYIFDQQAAWDAGMNFIAVLSGEITTREEFLDAGVHPSAILNSIVDLPAYLGIYKS